MRGGACELYTLKNEHFDAPKMEVCLEDDFLGEPGVHFSGVYRCISYIFF